MASSAIAAERSKAKLDYSTRKFKACSDCRRRKVRCCCQRLEREDCDLEPLQEECQLHAPSVIKDPLERYPVINVCELHGQDTLERTYSDLRTIVAAVAQPYFKWQVKERAKNITRISYSRLCSWKAQESGPLSERPSVLRIQVLSLVLFFEQSRGLRDSSTRDALHRACQIMLKYRFSSSLTTDEWHIPGLFDLWIVLSAAILLLNETDNEVAKLEQYFDLPYPRADQLAQRFGNIERAIQYTQRVQSMHDRYLPLQATYIKSYCGKMELSTNSCHLPTL